MDKDAAARRRCARVGVVVVTHQSAATVAAALRAVGESPLVSRVIVVDSGSGDGSPEVAREAGADDVVVLGANLGFAAGVNRGLQTLRDEADESEFVLLLNPDAEVEPEALERLVAALDADPRAAVVGPALVSASGERSLGARRFSTVWNRLALELPWFWRQPGAGPELPPGTLERAAGRTAPVDYVWGAALLARREFLAAVGGLDERFFLYHEDEDLGRRAAALGRLVLLVSGASARHVGAASSGGDAALAHARLLFATTQLLDKWSWRGSARLFALGALKGLVLQALAGLASGDRVRAREQLRCARLLLGFVRAGSARP